MKRHSNRHDIVIKAQIGETVNISCYFDPTMISSEQMNRFNRRFKKKRYVEKLAQSPSEYRTSTSQFPIENVFRSMEANTNHQRNTNIDEEANLQENSYEIDWFFLDNKGRMNIIR